jgi:hypothetical protein
MLTRAWMAPSLLFWTGFVLCGIGFVLNQMWIEVPWNGSVVLAGLAFGSLAVACVLGRLSRSSLVTSVVIVWLSALVYFVGFSSCAAVILIGLAAMAIGSLVVPSEWDARAGLSMLVGLVIFSGVDGWLLPFPVHFRAVYTILLLGLVSVRWRVLVQILRPIPVIWRSSVEATPAVALLAVTAVGVVSTCAWIPTIHYDDLAFHLGLPRQLFALGYYRMDVGSRIGALLAWSSDVLQGVAYVLAGEDARGAMDFLWLVLGAVFVWKLCESLALAPSLRWLAVALYASSPLTAEALSGMQTEGPTSAVVAGLALLIHKEQLSARRQFLLVALLFGALLNLKISNLMIAGALGLWLLWQWRGRMPWRTLPAALGLMAVIAGSSYFYSYLLTGNPVLPFFNETFQSSYYPITNFYDNTWSTGFRWDIIWRVVFHTSAYVEGGDGVAGFTLIALGGSLIVALFKPQSRPLALAAIVGFLLPLTQIQYVRYAHPAMVLLVPAMLCGVSFEKMKLQYVRGVMIAMAVLVICNLAFVSAGDWQLQKGVLWQFMTTGRSEVIKHYAPAVEIASGIQSRYGDSARVLIADASIPFAAELSGKAFVVNWYDQELSGLANLAGADSTGEIWLNLFDRVGANLVVVQKSVAPRGLDLAISRDGGRLVQEVSNLELWELHPEGVPGVAVAAPDGSVVVGFDTLSNPSHSTLVTANLELKCKLENIPIVVTWKIVEENGEQWRRSEWASCRQNGLAHAKLDVSIPRKITDFTVSAMPSRAVDMGLELVTANASFRNDLSAERDLAIHIRHVATKWLAAWVHPSRSLGPSVVGTPMLAPDRAVVVNFDTSAIPWHAARVDAQLKLKCRQKSVPIVVGWKVSEAGGGKLSSYQWAMCQKDGFATATVTMAIPQKVSGFVVTAMPSQAVDMALELSAASASFSSD